MSRRLPASVARFAILAAGLAVLGCALVRPGPLEVPNGHTAVLGRVDASGFGPGDAALMIVREDGTFDYTVPVGSAPTPFAIVLPRGRYRVVEFLSIRDMTGDQTVWPLRFTFETGTDRAVYIGTLRLNGGFGLRLQTAVLDQYEDTVRTLRRLYTELPEPIVRRLMTGS